MERDAFDWEIDGTWLCHELQLKAGPAALHIAFALFLTNEHPSTLPVFL